MTSCLGRRLDVEDPAAGGHPLGGAVGDDAAAAVGVLVLEGAVDHVGDGLEAAVGVPVGAPGLDGRVVDLAHLVHVDERVEVGQVDAGEGPPHREALALEAGRRGRDRPDGAGSVARADGGDLRQRQGVSGHGGHGYLQIVVLSTTLPGHSPVGEGGQLVVTEPEPGGGHVVLEVGHGARSGNREHRR